jgi:hypothetical protein
MSGVPLPCDDEHKNQKFAEAPKESQMIEPQSPEEADAWFSTMQARYSEIEPPPINACREELDDWFRRGMLWARREDAVGADRALEALMQEAVDAGVLEPIGRTADGKTIYRSLVYDPALAETESIPPSRGCVASHHRPRRHPKSRLRRRNRKQTE